MGIAHWTPNGSGLVDLESFAIFRIFQGFGVGGRLHFLGN
jgi:hypothetical protein